MIVLGLLRSLGLYRFARDQGSLLHLAAVMVGGSIALALGWALRGPRLEVTAHLIWTASMLITLYALQVGWSELIGLWRASDALKRRDLNVLGVSTIGWPVRRHPAPGMTGWAAIHGSRGPLHTPQDVRRRVQLDINYVERQSFWLDVWFMAATVPVLLGDRAAVR